MNVDSKGSKDQNLQHSIQKYWFGLSGSEIDQLVILIQAIQGFKTDSQLTVVTDMVKNNICG